jgi:hypothetical protein
MRSLLRCLSPRLPGVNKSPLTINPGNLMSRTDLRHAGMFQLHARTHLRRVLISRPACRSLPLTDDAQTRAVASAGRDPAEPSRSIPSAPYPGSHDTEHRSAARRHSSVIACRGNGVPWLSGASVTVVADLHRRHQGRRPHVHARERRIRTQVLAGDDGIGRGLSGRGRRWTPGCAARQLHTLAWAAGAARGHGALPQQRQRNVHGRHYPRGPGGDDVRNGRRGWRLR